MPRPSLPSFICPACQTRLPPLAAGEASLRCPACQVEVDAARLETLVGKPRFVAERSWTGAELDGILIEEVIGAGGMGTVYRGRFTAPHGGLLAVKFLAPSLAAEPEIVARFRREVALLEKLDHPGIVKVKAHGESQGLPWFAMELVEGPTLAGRLAKGPLSVAEAKEIFARLLEALGHAHDRGVVHRDLKPANVLLASDGARLADFGIARLDMGAATQKTQLTRTDAIIGTFSYMSPEQRVGRSVDARSDLYSAGVMLYEALAGERPEGAFPPLHRRRSEIPARVDDVVRRLLQPEPQARFASAGEASRALRAAFSPRPLVRRPFAWAAVAAVGMSLALLLALRERIPPTLPTEEAILEKKNAPSTPPQVAQQPANQVEQVPQPDLPAPFGKVEKLSAKQFAKGKNPSKMGFRKDEKSFSKGELFLNTNNLQIPTPRMKPVEMQAPSLSIPRVAPPPVPSAK